MPLKFKRDYGSCYESTDGVFLIVKRAPVGVSPRQCVAYPKPWRLLNRIAGVMTSRGTFRTLREAKERAQAIVDLRTKRREVA